MFAFSFVSIWVEGFVGKQKTHTTDSLIESCLGNLMLRPPGFPGGPPPPMVSAGATIVTTSGPPPGSNAFSVLVLGVQVVPKY